MQRKPSAGSQTFRSCRSVFCSWNTGKNHDCPRSHFDDECLCSAFLHKTWTWSLLLQENSCNRWHVMERTQRDKWSMLRCNEKDFFWRPCFHSSLMETWMNWMNVPQLQGREINIGPDYSSCHVWLPAEKQLFHSAVLTARHVLFHIKPSRSQSHLFVSKRGGIEFWDTTINSPWM